MKLILSISPKDLDNLLSNPEVARYKGGFLLSFLAIKDSKNLPEIANKIRKIKSINPNIVFMLDSGAHSFLIVWKTKDAKSKQAMGHHASGDAINIMKHQNIEKFIKQYNDFMWKYNDAFDVFVELDLQGIYGMEQVNNWRAMFSKSAGDKLMLVYHGEGREMLTDYCSRYKYIGLGGTSSENAAEIKEIRDAATISDVIQSFPANRFHLFAMTGNECSLYSSQGLFSADSTSWSLGSRFGLFYWFDGKLLKSQTKYFLRNDRKRADDINFHAWLDYGNFLNGLGKFKGEHK